MFCKLFCFNLLGPAFASVSFKHFLGLFLGNSFFVLLLALRSELFLLRSFSLHSLAKVLFFFLLFSNDLKVFFSIRSICELSLLVILVIDLGVILVLSSSSSVLSLHSSFFQITFSLGHEATVLSVESILELEEACIILSTDFHAHEWRLNIGVNVVSLNTICIFFAEAEVFAELLVVVLTKRR